MINRILVAFDGSDPAVRALEYTFEVFPDAEVTALTVIDMSSRYGYGAEFELVLPTQEQLEEERHRAATVLEQALEDVAPDRRDNRVETIVEVGKPAATILERATGNEVDQIVMGTHGRTGVSRVLFGSVAESVVRRSEVPVVVVS